MAHQVKHKFVSAVPDGGDNSLVRPSNWNDDHHLTIDLTAADITTSISGNAAETTITVVSNVGLYPGMFVSGTGLGTNAVISSISGTTITLNVANLGTVSGTGTFTSLKGPLPSNKMGVSGATISDVSASTTYYLGLTSASSGAWTDARVSTSNLYYTSSDNTLFATNVNTSSDLKLKDNVLTIQDGLNTIKKLRGVSFNWKDNGLKTYGVIAQEIEEYIPELVKEVDGVKSVNYTALIGFLIEAIKEQQEQIEELKSRVQ